MNDINYIVLLIDSKYKNHDGKVFKSYRMAKEWCRDVIQDGYADKIILGTVSNDSTEEERNIHLIETFGFKKDVTKFEQLAMFAS